MKKEGKGKFGQVRASKDKAKNKKMEKEEAERIRKGNRNLCV